MKNGDIIKLGTLKVNGTTYKMPSNPVQGGDCVSSNTKNIEIVNTENGKELQWVFVKHNGKPMLICDRCLVVNVSWDNLNAAKLILGKEITIDGQAYKIRSLTGGKSSSDKNNEWDDIIANNKYGIGSGNEIWHWKDMYTWCQETTTSGSSYRTLRGYSSASHWNNNTSHNNYGHSGFRPALEILNAAPQISGTDENIGDYNLPFGHQYTVTEADKESFSIVEELDGTQIRRLDNQTDGTFTVTIDAEKWKGLNLGPHTIKVTATDPKGAATVRTWTFNKINKPPVISDVDHDLGQQNMPVKKEYTITEPENEHFSIQEKVDDYIVRTLEDQVDGPFTVDITRYWEDLIVGKHTIKITATDVRGGVSVRSWTFNKINKPPHKPTFNKLKTGNRVDITNFDVEFTPQIDEEGDTQTFTLEVADDIDFGVNKVTRTDNLFMWDESSGQWTPATECTSANVGKKFKFSVTGLKATTVSKYIRIATTDARGSRSTTLSDIVKVGTINKLAFITKPYTPKEEPGEISFVMNSVIDTRANVKVYVTNNAKDPSPIWEDMSEEFKREDFHKFTNTTKTNGCHIATKVEIDAMDSTTEISIVAIMEVLKK